ncbi:MAG: ABC transporter ATP-binding protein [Lachnospiraceae bacterium]|nr:ABC transporter ATP-binding protein [Lachnospiraceae bacterium]
MKNAVVAESLAAGYTDGFCFKQLNLNIKQGKITTLIGANGSGKSTILKCMSRLISPKEGCVCLDGQSIFKMPTKAVAKRLALLPQNSKTPEGITVEELVENGRFPYRKNMSRMTAEDRKIVEWAMEVCNIQEFAAREVDELSGGQRQRVWIAMALAQKTEILFLDEPTTYLDIAHQLDIMQLLSKLNKEQGVTIAMVLHDLNHAAMYSDCIVAIKDGEKICEGTPEEIITPKILAQVFDIKATILKHPVLNVPVCLPYGLTR